MTVDFKDYYKILGFAREAGRDKFERVFRKLARGGYLTMLLREQRETR
jgi:hypothetical protein